MMKRYLLLILVLCFTGPFLWASSPKKGYEIKIKVTGIKDTVCYLANYYGDKTYLTDTGKVDGTGRFVFKGDEPLPGGIYMVAFGKTKLFEFIIDQNQFFSMETNGPDYTENMKLKGTPENEQFYQYLRFNAGKYKEAEPLQKLSTRTNASKDSVEYAKKRLAALNKEVEDYKMDFITKNPNTFMAHFFRAMKEIDLPDMPLKPNGSKDSLAMYNYYKAHYWDNIDLNDERLLRTPILHGKITTYFDKVLLQHVDTVIDAADKMIEKVRANKEMFKYFVWYLTNNYETSNVMGFDKIFVHMVETYYATNQAYWVNPTVLENLVKRSNKLKPILLGKVAPNMIMQDTALAIKSMYSVNSKYTVLFFWDPECGHCKTESPKMKKFYDEVKLKYNLEVFAVCTDTNLVKMKDYIKKNKFDWINVNGPRSVTPNFHDLYDVYSTPVIYLLDDKKTIIAKRLMAEQLEKFLERYDADKEKEKSQKK